jgi:glutaredoxin
MMGLGWLWPWRRPFFGPRTVTLGLGSRAEKHETRALPHWRVVFYTRRGCHLCDDAWALLQRAQRRHGFVLEAADVDADPALRERFGLTVPVVEVNGKVRFRGRVSPVLLDRLLAMGD